MSTPVAEGNRQHALLPAKTKEEERKLKTQQLEDLLSGDPDGQKAAQQLVQGGEHETEADITSPIFMNRWLRARSWNVGKTFEDVCKHAGWRVDMMPTGRIEESSIPNELASGKVILQGLDKASRPIAIVQVAKHNAWRRYMEELERFCCYALDLMVSIAPRDTNPRAHCAVVLNLSDMGYANLDVNAVRKLLHLLGEHYVERLGCLYFFNPPSLFWGAWTALSPLIPEHTRRKIKIVDPASPDALLNDVAPEVLPRELGGTAALAPPLGARQP